MKEGLKFDAVQPVRPIAPYVGGKRALAKRLVERIDATEHTVYAEPFVAWAACSSAAGGGQRRR
jgi:hypothetical protein